MKFEVVQSSQQSVTGKFRPQITIEEQMHAGGIGEGEMWNETGPSKFL